MLVMPPREKARRERENEEKRQNQIISGLLNEHDTETQTSDNVTIEDCTEAPINFKIRGKEIKQETREGYNLLDTKKYIASSGDGITPSTNEDGTINVIGTANRNYPLIIRQIDLLKFFEDGQALTIWQQEASSLIYLQIRIVSNDNVESYIGLSTNNLKTITIDKSKNKTYQLMMQGGSDVTGIDYNISNFKCMLLKGTYTSETIPLYEQYGVKPSLEFESPLQYIEGNQKVYHANENLIDMKSKMFSTANSGNIKICIIDDDIILNGTPTSSYVGLSTRINITDILKDNQAYTIYRENDNLVYNQISAIKYDGTVDYFSLNGSANKRTFIVDKTKYRKYEYYVQTNVLSVMKSLENYVVKCMLLEGDKLPKKFTSYSETINLTNMPDLYSENDCIYYDEKQKKYFVHNEYDKCVIDGINVTVHYNLFGNVNHSAYISNLRTKILIPATHNDVIDVTSDRFLKESINNIINQKLVSKIGVRTDGVVFFSFGEDSELTTTDLLNEYFAKNNTEIVYPLATPIETEITDTVLIEQLDKLRAIFTYEGTNHFIVTSENGISANLRVEAYKDSFKIMQKEIDNLKALVLENTVS